MTTFRIYQKWFFQNCVINFKAQTLLFSKLYEIRMSFFLIIHNKITDSLKTTKIVHQQTIAKTFQN